VTRALDHLVVAARTLAEGVDWCEATLGVQPTAGGQHLFMGTHNRVFEVSSAAFPRSYLEVVAIDPSLPAPAPARWFDLDDPALQQQLTCGPALVHRVDRVDDIEAARAALLADGIDCGAVTHAERGALRWRITLRADGRRAPTLIEWAGAHPTDAMSPSGVQLASMSAADMPLHAVFTTPRGRVALAALSLKA
jgi:catechol 2,3-dioxygenase-like lactoylglutathione lyase family enzyme